MPTSPYACARGHRILIFIDWRERVTRLHLFIIFEREGALDWCLLGENFLRVRLCRFGSGRLGWVCLWARPESQG